MVSLRAVIPGAVVIIDGEKRDIFSISGFPDRGGVFRPAELQAEPHVVLGGNVDFQPQNSIRTAFDLHWFRRNFDTARAATIPPLDAKVSGRKSARRQRCQ